jgi:hypothetical protein
MHQPVPNRSLPVLIINTCFGQCALFLASKLANFPGFRTSIRELTTDTCCTVRSDTVYCVLYVHAMLYGENEQQQEDLPIAESTKFAPIDRCVASRCAPRQRTGRVAL